MIAGVNSLTELRILDAGRGFRERTFSPLDLTRAALARIDATEPHLHAWVSVHAEQALAAAELAERELKAGIDRGPLHGIPIGVKDIFDVAGWPTRCGSLAREDAPPASQNAAAVDRLIAGGAVILGKTVTQEFAAGVISPPARNPWDPRRIPGGSSGGSAAAVAVGGCLGALGSDTGGSVRIPAAACGVTGFKPTYGQLDASGVFPLSWSLDTVGSLGRTVADVHVMWRVMRGERLEAVEDGAADTAALDEPIRIGVPRAFFFEWLQPSVLAAVEAAIDALKGAGVKVMEASWPEAAAARACAFMVNRVETAAVHESATTDPTQFARYGAELRLRIAAGLGIPATYYIEAVRARAALKRSVAEYFADHRVDAMLVPTLPTTALEADRLVIEETGRQETVGAGWTRLTMPFSATGQPVLALPCGMDQLRLPVGIQLAGRPGDETRLFAIGRFAEAVLGFHHLSPPPLSGDEESP